MRLVVDHEVLRIATEVDAEDCAQALLDHLCLSEARLDIVHLDATILAADCAGAVVRREPDGSNSLTVHAVLGLGDRCPIVTLHDQEIAVQHSDRDLLAIFGVLYDIGAALQLRIPGLPPSPDVPDAKHAVLAHRQELLLAGMSGKAADLVVVVRLQEEFGLLWLLLRRKLARELEDLSASRPNEECLSLWMLAHALHLWDYRLDLGALKINGGHLDQCALLDPPDNHSAIFVSRYQASLRGSRIQAVHCTLSRRIRFWSTSSNPG